MALFDSLFNLSPEQNQGLLAAAAQILQASGPQTRPTSFGQILGGGLQAFQQGANDAELMKQQRAQQLLNQRLLGLKVQDAESDIANQAATRQRASDLQKFYRDRAVGSNPASLVPAGQTANLAPTVENAANIPSASPARTGTLGLFDARLSEAQALRNAGFGPEADAAEAAALKFQPKVKGWEKVQQNGRVLFAPFYEDGTSGQPVPLDVAEKLEQVNLGGAQQLVNPFTGQVVTSTVRTATPGELLTAATTRRGQDLTFQTAGLDRAQRAANEKAPTEFQGKSATFGLRAEESNKILNNLQGKYNPSAINTKLAFAEIPLVGGVLGTAGNALLSPEDQQAEQAQRDFLNATLRQESGAAIGLPEFRNGQQQYFPQPGDSPAVIAQKARNRQLVIQGFKANAGKAALTALPASQSSGWSITKVGD